MSKEVSCSACANQRTEQQCKEDSCDNCICNECHSCAFIGQEHEEYTYSISKKPNYQQYNYFLLIIRKFN